MTDTEKLIEKAAKAMANAPHAASWDAHSEDERDWYRKDAAIALAVFEQAHTPTDDEREDEHQAQMIAFETAKLEARNSMRHDPHVWHEALEDALDKVLPAVWHVAADFRRSEVPARVKAETAASTIDGIDAALRGDGRSAMLVVAAQEIINNYRDKADG